MPYPARMTALLAKALSKLQNLPDQEQDALAALILKELESEQAWDASFAASQGPLSRLAEQAVAEYKAGKTAPLDPDRDL